MILTTRLEMIFMRRLVLWTVVVAVFGLHVGCETKTASPVSGTQTPAVTAPGGAEAVKLSGKINIDGSSTVAPITSIVAEDFGNARCLLRPARTPAGFVEPDDRGGAAR